MFALGSVEPGSVPPLLQVVTPPAALLSQTLLSATHSEFMVIPSRSSNDERQPETRLPLQTKMPLPALLVIHSC